MSKKLKLIYGAVAGVVVVALLAVFLLADPMDLNLLPGQKSKDSSANSQMAGQNVSDAGNGELGKDAQDGTISSGDDNKDEPVVNNPVTPDVSEDVEPSEGEQTTTTEPVPGTSEDTTVTEEEEPEEELEEEEEEEEEEERGDYVDLLFSGKTDESYQSDATWLMDASDEDVITLFYTCADSTHAGWGVLGWGATVDGNWVEGPTYSADGSESTLTCYSVSTVAQLKAALGIKDDSTVDSIQLGSWNSGKIVGLYVSTPNMAPDTSGAIVATEAAKEESTSTGSSESGNVAAKPSMNGSYIAKFTTADFGGDAPTYTIMLGSACPSWSLGDTVKVTVVYECDGGANGILGTCVGDSYAWTTSPWTSSNYGTYTATYEVTPSIDNVQFQVYYMGGTAIGIKSVSVAVTATPYDGIGLWTATNNQPSPNNKSFSIASLCSGVEDGDTVTISATLYSADYFNGCIGGSDVDETWIASNGECTGGTSTWTVTIPNVDADADAQVQIWWTNANKVALKSISGSITAKGEGTGDEEEGGENDEEEGGENGGEEGGESGGNEGGESGGNEGGESGGNEGGESGGNEGGESGGNTGGDTQSSVCTLASLTLPDGATISPAFASDTTQYTINVGYSIKSITYTHTLTDANSSADATGTFAGLAVGENSKTITVTAQDGSTKTYSFTIVREAPDYTAIAALSGTDLLNTCVAWQTALYLPASVIPVDTTDTYFVMEYTGTSAAKMGIQSTSWTWTDVLPCYDANGVAVFSYADMIAAYGALENVNSINFCDGGGSTMKITSLEQVVYAADGEVNYEDLIALQGEVDYAIRTASGYSSAVEVSKTNFNASTMTEDNYIVIKFTGSTPLLKVVDSGWSWKDATVSYVGTGYVVYSQAAVAATCDLSSYQNIQIVSGEGTTTITGVECVTYTPSSGGSSGGDSGSQPTAPDYAAICQLSGNDMVNTAAAWQTALSLPASVIPQDTGSYANTYIVVKHTAASAPVIAVQDTNYQKWVKVDPCYTDSGVAVFNYSDISTGYGDFSDVYSLNICENAGTTLKLTSVQQVTYVADGEVDYTAVIATSGTEYAAKTAQNWGTALAIYSSSVNASTLTASNYIVVEYEGDAAPVIALQDTGYAKWVKVNPCYTATGIALFSQADMVTAYGGALSDISSINICENVNGTLTVTGVKIVTVE